MKLPGDFHAESSPADFPAPKLVILNRALAESLGLDADVLESPPHSQVFSGSVVPLGARPIAQAYAGHQFGHFTLLGDGRAMLLGEHLCPDGRRVDIHLKGSGLTAYSRRGDGRASLGPMLREFIISESLHALGIPTTRSLAVALTGEEIFRSGIEAGAVLTRVASSHIRVGTFQWAAAHGDVVSLHALVRYAVARHLPKGDGADPENSAALRLLDFCVASQAKLIASWMLVGFIHGVMNTDNMAVSGETLDFGPCAFMDTFNPRTVFSSIDHHGRYAYANQPEIALWNLTRLAEALLGAIHPDHVTALAQAERSLQRFPQCYADAWSSGMRCKLGLQRAETGDADLFESLLEAMEHDQLDYTRTFRHLPRIHPQEASPKLARWLLRWRERLGRQALSAHDVQAIMDRHNPAVIPRNHQVENALAAASMGDLAPMKRLLNALAEPFSDSAPDDLCQPPPRDFEENYQTYCGT